MSDNKLSREIDCMECEFHQLGGIYVCIEAENPKADNSKRRCKLFQPKSLLTPIPEEKLDELVDKWNIKFHVHPDWIKQMLQEYDALKGEGGG